LVDDTGELEQQEQQQVGITVPTINPNPVQIHAHPSEDCGGPFLVLKFFKDGTMTFKFDDKEQPQETGHLLTLLGSITLALRQFTGWVSAVLEQAKRADIEGHLAMAQWFHDHPGEGRGGN
jgi:hypothetical protein